VSPLLAGNKGITPPARRALGRGFRVELFLEAVAAVDLAEPATLRARLRPAADHHDVRPVAPRAEHRRPPKAKAHPSVGWAFLRFYRAPAGHFIVLTKSMTSFGWDFTWTPS
jgi:hypothetical protein